MPWVHIDDVAGMIAFSLENEQVKGPVNLCSPSPSTNREFTRAFSGALDKVAILPVPTIVLKGLPGGMKEMFLYSHRVDPVVMKSHNYEWEYPKLEDAVRASPLNKSF